jgi:hypothetical protein
MIQWEIYHRAGSFPLLEAAFLWLEIEPTPELLVSPPHRVLTLMKIMEHEIDIIQFEFWLAVAERIMESKKLSFSEAVEYIVKPIPSELELEIRELLPSVKKQKPRTDFEAKRALRNHMAFDSKNGTKSVHTVELKKLADKWEEKPKFLFPDFEEKFNKTSYYKLIKVLCAAAKIDIKSKDAAGKILAQSQLTGIKITEPTILKILDEVEQSRLFNSNRRTKKTKS